MAAGGQFFFSKATNRKKERKIKNKREKFLLGKMIRILHVTHSRCLMSVSSRTNQSRSILQRSAHATFTLLLLLHVAGHQMQAVDKSIKYN
jgi:hypothetical protein